MSPTVDNLSVQITASANGAVSAINRLASAVGGMRGVANSVSSSLKQASSGVEDYRKETSLTTDAVKKSTSVISQFWNVLKRGAGLLGSGVGKLAMLPKFFANDFVNGVSKAAKSVENLGAALRKFLHLFVVNLAELLRLIPHARIA